MVAKVVPRYARPLKKVAGDFRNGIAGDFSEYCQVGGFFGAWKLGTAPLVIFLKCAASLARQAVWGPSVSCTQEVRRFLPPCRFRAQQAVCGPPVGCAPGLRSIATQCAENHFATEEERARMVCLVSVSAETISLGDAI